MQVIALFGPTGVGKTAVTVALAARLRAPARTPSAVSADALQVYRGLETLTGVASAAERAQLEHRLISFLPVDASFSAGQYAELAHAEIDGLLAAGTPSDRRRRDRPLPAGGPDRSRPAPAPPEGLRERLTGELERRGAPALHARLASGRPGPPPRSTPRTASGSCGPSSCSSSASCPTRERASRPRARHSSGRPRPATRRCSSGSSLERELL